MNKVVIFGGTGFIGTSLSKHLIDHNYHVVQIGRSQPKEVIGTFLQWDGETLGEWSKELEGCTAIINLAGKSVNCQKTPENCDVILRSRVHTTKLIGDALQATKNQPTVWIQMSTAHIYGDPPKHICTEKSHTGYGLAPFVGKAWEKSFQKNRPATMRGVVLRTGFVIGKNGGALENLTKIAKMGLGGTVGHGKQGMSWIHEFDMNEIFRTAIVDSQMEGIYNVSSPKPVAQKEFMKTLRKVNKILIGLPSPKWLTSIGAKLVFNTDPELAIYGRYVIPKRILETGFDFKYVNLKKAIEHLK